MQVWVGVQEQPHNDMMLIILVAYLHNIMYAYKTPTVCKHIICTPHDMVKSVYESQMIGAYHGGKPRKSVQRTLTLINLITV